MIPSPGGNGGIPLAAARIASPMMYPGPATECTMGIAFNLKRIVKKLLLGYLTAP